MCSVVQGSFLHQVYGASELCADFIISAGIDWINTVFRLSVLLDQVLLLWLHDDILLEQKVQFASVPVCILRYEVVCV